MMTKTNNQEVALALCRAAEALAEIKESELERLGVTLSPDDLLAAAGKINQPVTMVSVSVTDGTEPF